MQREYSSLYFCYHVLHYATHLSYCWRETVLVAPSTPGVGRVNGTVSGIGGYGGLMGEQETMREDGDSPTGLVGRGLEELQMKLVCGMMLELGLVVMGEGERTGLLGCSCTMTPGLDVQYTILELTLLLILLRSSSLLASPELVLFILAGTGSPSTQPTFFNVGTYSYPFCALFTLLLLLLLMLLLLLPLQLQALLMDSLTGLLQPDILMFMFMFIEYYLFGLLLCQSQHSITQHNTTAQHQIQHIKSIDCLYQYQPIIIMMVGSVLLCVYWVIKYVHYITNIQHSAQVNKDMRNTDHQDQPVHHKKLTLRGVRIASPPPNLLTFISQPSQSSSSPQHKEQQICSSQSSSQQQKQEQQYYHNYLNNQIDAVVRQMLGQDVEYRIMDVIGGKSGDSDGEHGDEVVDIVVHVILRDGQLGQFKQVVHQIKNNNIIAGQPGDNGNRGAKVDDKRQGTNNMKSGIASDVSKFLKKKIQQQQQQSLPQYPILTYESSSQSQLQQQSDGEGQGPKRKQSTNHNRNDKHKQKQKDNYNYNGMDQPNTLNQINMSRSLVDDVIAGESSNIIVNSSSGRNKKNSNQGDEISSYNPNHNHNINNKDDHKYGQESVFQNQIINYETMEYNQLHGQQNSSPSIQSSRFSASLPQRPVISFTLSKPIKYLIIIMLVISGLFILASLLVQRRSQSKMSTGNAMINSWKNPQTPYFGDLTPQYQRKVYAMPLQAKQHFNQITINSHNSNTVNANADTDTQLLHPYVQQIPAVEAGKSMHPRNVPYTRSSSMKIFTYPSVMHSNSSHAGQLDKQQLLLSSQQAQINKFVSGLGSNQSEITANLYKQMQARPNDRKIIEAEYVYLANKYPEIAELDRIHEKPMCVIAYADNIIPMPHNNNNKTDNFFESVMKQNYSNYRLIIVDNTGTPEEQYELPKLMTILWRNYHAIISRVGDNNFYFVKLDEKVEPKDARMAAVRQLCGDGDIVLQIDVGEHYDSSKQRYVSSGFVGRQAFALISIHYDGGYERSAIRPKIMKSASYETYASSADFKDVVTSRRSKSSSVLDKKDNKGSLTTGQSKKVINSFLNKNGTLKPPINPKSKKSDFVLTSRVLGNVWLALNHKYLKQIDQQTMIVQSQSQTQAFYNSYLNAIDNNYKSITDSEKVLSIPVSPCFQSFVVELHNRLSEVPGSQTSDDQYLTMLELVGKLKNNQTIKSKGIAQGSTRKLTDNGIVEEQIEENHYEVITEPICYQMLSAYQPAEIVWDDKTISNTQNSTKEQQEAPQSSPPTSLHTKNFNQCEKSTLKQQNLKTLMRYVYAPLTKITSPIETKIQKYDIANDNQLFKDIYARVKSQKNNNCLN